MKTSISSVVIGYTVLALTAGCASMNTSRMLPANTPANRPLPMSIEIGSVTGGQKPTFGGPESITNETFGEVLREALRASQRFSAVGEDADLQLTATILHQSQKISMGYHYTGYLTVNYSIHDAASGDPLWQEHIRSSFEASAISGAKRTVQAREGSVRQNLASLMTALADWDGSDAVLTSSELVARLHDYAVGNTNIERFNADFGRVAGATKRDYLSPDDIRLQRRSWRASDNGRTDAELVFLRALHEQETGAGESRVPIALLVFEDNVLAERIGPSMNAYNYLASISDALQAREFAAQQEQAASLDQHTSRIVETRAKITDGVIRLSPDGSVQGVVEFSGEISVLDKQHGAAVLRSGMTKDEVAGTLRAGNVRFELIDDDIWLAGDRLLIFENNRLTRYSL